MKTLVAYYSRTNITKKLALEIAEAVNADTEEIISKVNYDGKLGYARAGKDGMTAKIIDLETLKHDPVDYDLIYLGVPVWAGKAANPLISYIKQNEGKFSNVKFFATAGKSGRSPLKTLALTTKEVKSGDYKNKLSSFLE